MHNRGRVARILLVDDDIAEISAVKRVLARGGHQPVLATNAADAVATLARARPDLLLVGASCEGGEALRRIVDDGAAQAVPLVVLGEVVGAPEGSAQLARPVDPAQLADQVVQSLGAGLARAAGAAGPDGVAARKAGAGPDGVAGRRAAA